MRRLPASAVLFAVLVVGGCKRATEIATRYSSSGGDVGDTTLHFGQLDTTLLTNGSGWVRKQPGVMPDFGPPQQLQAPTAVDSAFSPADSANPPGAPDSSRPQPRSRRDSLPDTLSANPDTASGRQRRDSSRPRRHPARPDTSPDTGVPDSTS